MRKRKFPIANTGYVLEFGPADDEIKSPRLQNALNGGSRFGLSLAVATVLTVDKTGEAPAAVYRVDESSRPVDYAALMIRYEFPSASEVADMKRSYFEDRNLERVSSDRHGYVIYCDASFEDDNGDGYLTFVVLPHRKRGRPSEIHFYIVEIA